MLDISKYLRTNLDVNTNDVRLEKVGMTPFKDRNQ